MIFQSFGFKRTWWRFFHERCVCNKFDVYIVIVITGLLCVFTFLAPCCDVRYDFCIITIFGSSLLPVVCSMSYLRYFCLLAYSGVQRILCCVFVFLVFVLCTLCCKFLEIVLFWLPLRYSLTVIIYIHGIVMFRLASVIVPNVSHSPQCFGVVMFRLASVIVPNSFSFLFPASSKWV